MACSRFQATVALLIAAAITSQLAAVEPVRLTHDGRMKFTPVFINGGEDLVYVEIEDPRMFRLQRLQLADGAVEPVHKTVSAQEFDPAYSADGNYYTYLKAVGTLSVGMVISSRTKTDEVQLAPGQGFSGYRSPAIAPDSSQVLFSFAEEGKQDIFRVDIKGKNRKALTGGKGINIWPDFSPDGSRVAFCSTRDGNFELYLMKPDGSEITRVTSNPFQDLRPRFSPDGKRLAFASHRDGNFEIYLVNTDGSNLQRITKHEERDDYPAWDPDGKSLVIVSEREGEHDLYRVAVPPYQASGASVSTPGP
jgi:Tol biopolymer transport system component